MKRRDIIISLFVAVTLAFVFSPFASSSPDGLEKIAEQKGFLEKGEGPAVLKAPIPDYTWPRVANKKLATSLSGLVGVLIVFGLTYGLASSLKRKEHKVRK